MSNYFRGRPPRLSDRFRGKSSEEILEELKDQLDKEREMFFESSPGFNFRSPRSSSAAAGRSGFPFGDFPRRSSSRAAFEDLVSQHPMFARMRTPDWDQDLDEDVDGGYFSSVGRGGFPSSVMRNRRYSGSSGISGASEEDSQSGTESQSQDSAQSSASSASTASSGSFGGGESIPITVTHEWTGSQKKPVKEFGPVKSGSHKLPQYTTRNTTELPHQEQEAVPSRNQRARSEPPQSAPAPEKPEPKRYISKVHITPINPAAANLSRQVSGNINRSPTPYSPSNKPPATPKSQSPHTLQQQHTFPHENLHEASPSPPPQLQQQARPQQLQQQARPQQLQQQARPQQSPQQQTQTNIRHIPIFLATKTSSQKPAPEPYPPQACQQTKPQPFTKPEPSCQHEPNSGGVEGEPVASTESLLDAGITKVEAIQKDVEGLMANVEAFSGIRGDKEFKFLDEMLTRNMIKLDDIDAAGRDDVRQVRRQAIKSIQRCISLLESKGACVTEETSEEPEVVQTEQENKENKVTSKENTTEETGSIPLKKVEDQLDVQEQSVTVESDGADIRETAAHCDQDRKEIADTLPENRLLKENVCGNEATSTSENEANVKSCCTADSNPEIAEENMSEECSAEDDPEPVELRHVEENDQEKT